MAGKKKERFTVRDEELAGWLSITIDRLNEIVDFFDSDPDDEWDLVERTDYRFFNKAEKIRIFSVHGALKIAHYLDQQKRGLWYDIVEFLTRHDKRLRRSLARKLINEELGDEDKLMLVGGRSMMHKQSLRRILETSGGRLNKSIKDVQRSQRPMEKRVDFDEVEGELWFAGSGAEKIAKNLGENLTNKGRRKMCLEIGHQIEPTVKMLKDARERREREVKEAIDDAKRLAKKRDKMTCQVTLEKKSQRTGVEVAAHHLFSAAEYPDLAANVDNLIVIQVKIHREFHSWMGGSRKGCTLDDFIEFLHDCYDDAPGTDALSARLHQLRKVLVVKGG
ncbi:MAG: hypothetical protein J7647_30900 [Cyanobacteria bacterium SBLK]|nr:hypothetical protein [Cyanobacteria bacterium SBLK]